MPNIIQAAHLFRAGPPLRVVSDNPIFRAMEEMSSWETPAQAWLRQVGPIARRLNEEAGRDPEPPEAA